MSLDNQIKDFEKAKSGTELKSTLISLLEALVRDTNYGASDLSGYLAGDFLTIDDLMSNYDSYCEVINYVTVSEVPGTIYDKLSKISDVKEQMRLAINKLYKTDIIKSGKTENPYDIYKFEDYAELINTMPQNVDVRVLVAGQIEENGEFEADEGKAYGAVVVAVPQPILTTRAISRNGTYDARQDGADGYSSVTVSITGNVASYTVRFMSEDGSQVLWTALNVPYDGFASYNGSTPVSSDPTKTFTGWSPTPDHIMADTDCYPIFEVVSQATEEISDSWETIVQNHGVGYPIGSYKSLTFDPSATLNNDLTGNGSGANYNQIRPWRLMKVASGEGGSRSTWLGVTYLMSDSPAADYYDGRIYLNLCESDIYPTNAKSFSWADRQLRSWLNTVFLNFLPAYLRNAIVAVPKYSIGENLQDPSFIKDVSSRDKIWLPSVKELFGSIQNVYQKYSTDLQVNINKSFDNSGFGADYSDVFLASGATYQDMEVVNATISRELSIIPTRSVCMNGVKMQFGNNYYCMPSYLTISTHITALDTGNMLLSTLNTSTGVFGFCL